MVAAVVAAALTIMIKDLEDQPLVVAEAAVLDFLLVKVVEVVDVEAGAKMELLEVMVV
tara:strand:- start:196 stop:369 length:174 start_codon:yes stop_codon:yes gene_type:complete